MGYWSQQDVINTLPLVLLQHLRPIMGQFTSGYSDLPDLQRPSKFSCSAPQLLLSRRTQVMPLVAVRSISSNCFKLFLTLFFHLVLADGRIYW